MEAERQVNRKRYGWLSARGLALELKGARIKVPQIEWDAVVLEALPQHRFQPLYCRNR
jgi:hypothetical protein